MATFSARSAVVGFGRQTAEGTGLTVPKLEIPMGSGRVTPVRETAELPWTNDSQDPIGDYVSRAGGEFSMTLPVLPVSSGALMQLVLGSLATTGAGPYTHTITPADIMSWATIFYAQPGGEYHKLIDAKVGSWELSASAGNPLEMSISGMGKTETRAQPAAKWGAATVAEGVDPFFTMIGSTIKLEHSTSPASTTVRNVPNVTVGVNRNLEAIQTDGIGYQYIAEQKRDLSVSHSDVVMEDSNFINTIFYGSPTGTTVASQAIYGSAEYTFVGSDEAAAATRSLKISLPRVMWNIAEVPGADPGGGVVRYSLEGRVSKPTSGASITVTLINGNAGTAVY